MGRWVHTAWDVLRRFLDGSPDSSKSSISFAISPVRCYAESIRGPRRTAERRKRRHSNTTGHTDGLDAQVETRGSTRGRMGREACPGTSVGVAIGPLLTSPDLAGSDGSFSPFPLSPSPHRARGQARAYPGTRERAVCQACEVDQIRPAVGDGSFAVGRIPC